MYKVITRFKDLQDHNHVYSVGDEYPRAGAKASKRRIGELSSSKNKRGIPLIEEVVKQNADVDMSGDPKLVRSRSGKV